LGCDCSQKPGSHSQSLFGFFPLRFVWRSRISEPPCVFGQIVDIIQAHDRNRDERQAELFQFVQIVRLPEGPLMPGQKRFQRFLGALLGMKKSSAGSSPAISAIHAPRSDAARFSHSRVFETRNSCGFIQQLPFANHGGWKRGSHVRCARFEVGLSPGNHILWYAEARKTSIAAR
jgi:hypothetical protein